MGVYTVNGTEQNYAYDVSGSSLSGAYTTDGQYIPFYSVDWTSYTVDTSYLSVSVANTQGLAYSDGYLFQFRASGSTVTDTVVVIDVSDGSIVHTFTIDSDHGDSASFSNQYYSQSDAFPLLYVTSDTNPALVYVNRVTTSSSTLIKTLAFPIAQAGYYAAACLDYANNIIYMVGYKEQNYQTDNNGSNTTVISKWDLSDLTDNGDNTYTPAFISSYERAFIYVMQGQQFHDGMLWISSGYGGNESYIYVLNPSDGTVLYTYDLGTTAEVEGLDFISNHEMIVGFQGGAYYKYTFATVE